MKLNLRGRFLASKGSRVTEDGSIKFTDHTNKLYSQGKATVSKEIRPHMPGRVYFQGTWWPARCESAACLLPDGGCKGSRNPRHNPISHANRVGMSQKEKYSVSWLN